MELKRLVRILRKRWTLIVAFTLLGLVGGAASALLTPVQYQSSTRVFVAAQIQNGSTPGDLVQGNNFVVQKLPYYLDVATSPRVLDPVITRLKLNESAVDLARRVTATTQPGSAVIEIAALASTADAAQQLAQAVSESFTDVVINQLETPADGGASPVTVGVLDPAVSPDNPALPLLYLNLAFGLLIGLLVGLVTALILGLLDRRISNRDDIERLTVVPVLGSIPLEAGGNPIITPDGASTARAEAFRVLRTNLEFADADTSRRSLVVTSSVSGEGKTTTLVNLAIVLAESGATVAVIDADLRTPRLADYLGLDADRGLTDVLVGDVQLKESLQSWGTQHPLTVLSSGKVPTNPSELLGSTTMGTVLDVLSSSYDYVLIDAPSVLAVTDAAVLSRWTGGTVLVVGANRVREPELLAAFHALEAVGTTPLGVVLAMVPTRGPDALVRDGGFAATTRTAPRATRPIDADASDASRSTPPERESASTDAPAQQRVTW
ncbi:MAG: polysaccharide biosynthesis tyrosine autokinase [Cryobacterium sp.]|uniref:polysaccharide biosynthesis tyrosine autokinase n=1 Tax=unclassified Cryobacterium TaxID=2649013 RepID=UPI0018CAE564|nr:MULTISPECIES: polysaccharide biosynthesis tyrosine autokinase [unclassified Cryobacterium]MCY7404114.1 polysaccharide biosynthesis tyrosine autokinase [Cryobacterium sp.]MEC5153496.1 capsular exopolysaccharide synthesis family protein [Cryobacterium sp. CAN_C3]